MDKSTRCCFGLIRYNHFYHGNSGKKRAQSILDLIEKGASYKTISNAVTNAFDVSGNKQHSYSRYLVETFSNAKQKVVDVGMSDSAFQVLKDNFHLDALLSSSNASIRAPISGG